MKATPGPWNNRNTNSPMTTDRMHSRIIAEDGQVVAYIPVTMGRPGTEGFYNADANARLLAAAPALIAALENIERTLADHPDVAIGNSKVHYVYHKARNTRIAAKGE